MLTNLTKLNLSSTILNKCAAIIMMVAVVTTTFSKAIAVVDYQMNKSYIASTLCMNRGKLNCCCKGKCFLKKQLQKDEGTGKNGVPVSKDKLEISLYCEDISPSNFIHPIIGKLFSGHFLVKKYAIVSSPVFHPPGIV